MSPSNNPRTALLDEMWHRLQAVRTLHFTASSGLAQGGWHGEGSGTVAVTSPDDHTLLFAEAGTWTPAGGAALPFRNVYRWTHTPHSIHLEHLRFGPENPVYLVELIPVTATRWVSVEAHRCNEDRYTLGLELQPDCLLMTWTIQGPAKDEVIVYRYA